jgi:hypothetical protein
MSKLISFLNDKLKITKSILMMKRLLTKKLYLKK